MPIRSRPDCGGLGAHVHAAPLGPTEEEALLGGEAVDGGQVWRAFLLEGLRVQLQPTVVRNVLAKSQLSVHLDAVYRVVTRVLPHEAGGMLPVAPRVLGRPPIPHVAGTVEKVALVVEGMRQLVADHASRPTVSNGLVYPGIVERWLQDTGGKDHDVEGIVVVTLDTLGELIELILVDGSTALPPFALGLQLLRAPGLPPRTPPPHSPSP